MYVASFKEPTNVVLFPRKTFLQFKTYSPYGEDGEELSQPTEFRARLFVVVHFLLLLIHY